MKPLFKFSFLSFLILLLLSFGACKSDSVKELPTIDEREVWTGSTLTFEKSEGSDPTTAANQDQITDNVWITRQNEGKQIFNSKMEESASKQDSPAGTLWAVGTIDNIDNLDFKKFREAVDKPKTVVGKDLVVFLTEDNVFLSLKFTKWSEDKAGGFAYERSSK